MGRNRSLFLALVVCLLTSGCANQFFYYPDRKVYHSPREYDLQYESVFFPSQDDTKLHGWVLRGRPQALGTVIFFHGNARNMTANLPLYAWLPAEGFNVFVFDYRGYGRSEGRPDRQGVHEDSVAAFEYVLTRTDLERPLFVLAQSLGGATAIAALGQNDFPVEAVVVDSSFYSYRKIARDTMSDIPLLSMFRFPLSLTISNRHSPASFIDRLAPTPLCLIHGTSDDVVPYEHSILLYEQAKEPKELWLIERGGHVDALRKPDSVYRKKLSSFFRRALEKTGSQTARQAEITVSHAP